MYVRNAVQRGMNQLTTTTRPTCPAATFTIAANYAERLAFGLDAIQLSNLVAARLVTEFRVS